MYIGTTGPMAASPRYEVVDNSIDEAPPGLPEIAVTRHATVGEVIEDGRGIRHEHPSRKAAAESCDPTPRRLKVKRTPTGLRGIHGVGVRCERALRLDEVEIKREGKSGRSATSARVPTREFRPSAQREDRTKVTFPPTSSLREQGFPSTCCLAAARARLPDAAAHQIRTTHGRSTFCSSGGILPSSSTRPRAPPLHAPRATVRRAWSKGHPKTPGAVEIAIQTTTQYNDQSSPSPIHHTVEGGSHLIGFRTR